MVNRVTFTGVDNHTDMRALKEISKQYPFAEFGVLMSRNNTGTNVSNRYPEPEAIRNLQNIGVPCSAHICGEIARTAMATGNFGPIEAFLEERGLKPFDRMQLNIKNFDGYREFAYDGSTPIIIQVSDEKAAKYYEHMRMLSANVQALFDISGGQGLSGLDGGFDVGFGSNGYVGFAGGLNPTNVSFALGYIAAGTLHRPGGQDFWIDMESGVRTDDWFDLDKVRAVCESVSELIGN